jgi:O-antigen ligase
MEQTRARVEAIGKSLAFETKIPGPSISAGVHRAIVLLLAWSLPTSLFGMQAAVVAGALLVLLYAVMRRFRGLEPTPLDQPIFVWVGSILVSLWLSPEGATSFHSATSFWIAATYYVVWFCILDKKTLRMAIVGVVMIATAVSCLGIYQSLTGNYPLSRLLHPLLSEGAFTVPGIPGKHGAIGLFYSRITFAHALLFPFCWTLSFALEPLGRRVRILSLLAGLAIGFAILMSWTRAALVVSIASAFSLVVLHFRTRWKMCISVIGVILALLGGAMVFAPENIERLNKSFASDSDWGRLTIWQAALDMASDHPITGVGWGNFPQSSLSLIDGRLASVPWAQFSATRAWAHGNLFSFWAETGMVGVLALCYLWVVIAGAYRRVLRDLPSEAAWERAFVRGAAVSVVAFFALGMVHDTFVHGAHAESVFLLWFTLASSLLVGRWNREPGKV